MVNVPKISIRPLNPGEAKTLKALVYDLSEVAVRQALYGLIQVLSFKVNIPRAHFEEVLDDAKKYTQTRKGAS